MAWIRDIALVVLLVVSIPEDLFAQEIGGSDLSDLHTAGQVFKDERGVAFVRYEREFPYPAQVVWDAITDPASRLKVFTSADLRVGGTVSIRFSEELEEFSKITRLDEPALLEFVNLEKQGHPEKYFTDTLEITDRGDACTVAYTTPIGREGRLQLGIALGWHIWIDNWRMQLDDPSLTRAQVDATHRERAELVSAPYVEQLERLYPDWPGN